VLLGKTAGLTGIALGFFLLLAPNKIRNIENIMNIEVDTQSVVDRLDESHNDIDPIFFQHSFLLGSTGLIVSIILTILSITNLM
jgi:ABC-type lipoprotein release transport system permease subunit